MIAGPHTCICVTAMCVFWSQFKLIFAKSDKEMIWVFIMLPILLPLKSTHPVLVYWKVLLNQIGLWWSPWRCGSDWFGTSASVEFLRWGRQLEFGPVVRFSLPAVRARLSWVWLSPALGWGTGTGVWLLWKTEHRVMGSGSAYNPFPS